VPVIEVQVLVYFVVSDFKRKRWVGIPRRVKPCLKPWEGRAAKGSRLYENRTLHPFHPTFEQVDSPSCTDDACLHAIWLTFVERPKERESIARILGGLAVAKEQKRLRNGHQFFHVLLLFVLRGVFAVIW
jgi:hypothetical protein